KLIGGKSFIHWKKQSQNKISITETLAIFGPRLCIDIVPQSRFASHLVAGYMHLCLNISDDREYVVTSMPTEPVLAEASARIMNDPTVRLAELINQLSSALKKGVVEAGYRGELTARLLLLKAWDNCIQKKHPGSRDIGNDYSHFMTINEFLKSLLADNVYKKIEDNLKTQVKFTGTTFGEAYIKFTHFINVTYTPNRKNLGKALMRGVAFSCKRNQRGVDIIIPIYMGILHERLNEDRISYILIQVKNWATDNKGDDYPLSATAKLSPAYIDIEKLPYMPFLSLYLQLGAIAEFADVPTEFIQTRQVTLCKRKIEEVLEDYQAGDIETRGEFVKKIRIDDDKDISNAEITAFREHFQTPLALFGLSPNVYSCLEQPTPVSATSPLTITNDLASSFKQLLTAWVDPTLGEHPEEMKIIERMEPLVYNMEE
ncbi:11791_t:CDS:1, partial [Gigaspora margarita]